MAIVGHVGIGMLRLYPTTNTRGFLRGTGTDYSPSLFSFVLPAPSSQGAGAQGAGPRAAIHDSWAARRRAQGAADILPYQRAAGRRTDNLEPCNLAAKPPSNKNTSLVGGSWTKKKLTPPHRVCPKCHAIWDFEMEKRSFLVIFSSAHTGTPSMHRYTSGIPSPARFSIRWQWVFFGNFCLNEFHSWRSVRGIFNPLHIVKGMWVSFAEIIESSDDLFPRQLVKLVDVVLFPPVYGQATQRRPDLLGVDGGRELTRLFCPARQFVESFQLSDKGHAVFALSLFPQFFDQVSDQRVRRAVQQFIGMLLGSVGGVSSQPSAFGIAVSALDIVPGEFSLPVCQASGLLWQGKPPIGFSVGFCFSKGKGRARRTRSVLNVLKCVGILSMISTLFTLNTLNTPFPKIFFKKVFPTEKAIGADTYTFFCLHNMGLCGITYLMNSDTTWDFPTINHRGPRFKLHGGSYEEAE